MYIVRENEDTGDYDIVDPESGVVVDSVEDKFAALPLCRMYNDEDQA